MAATLLIGGPMDGRRVDDERREMRFPVAHRDPVAAVPINAPVTITYERYIREQLKCHEDAEAVDFFRHESLTVIAAVRRLIECYSPTVR